MPIMDTCTYCRREGRYMMLYVKKGEKIRICHSIKCQQKAAAAGFYRMSY